MSHVRRLQTEGEHEQAEIVGVGLADTTLRGTRFHECHFRDCRFSSVQFVECRFHECTIESCDFVACGLAGSQLRDVAFSGSRLMGLDWTEVDPTFFSVSFDSCRLDHSVFTGLDLRRVRFRDCRLFEVAFEECDLSGASFPGSDLTGAILRHANLEGADLGDATGCFFDLETCRTSGTVIAPETALALLEHRGLKCRQF